MAGLGAVGRARRLVQVVEGARRAFGTGRVRTLRRVLELRRTRGFDLGEIAVLGMLDPSFPPGELERCVPNSRLRATLFRLTPEPLTTVIDDKALFARTCTLAGLPTPPLRCVLYAGHPGWTFDGATPLTRDEWGEALARVLPPAFVSKPVLGDRGAGVRAFAWRDGRVLEGGRELGDALALYDSLLADPRQRGFVLQDRVENHELIAALSGTGTLQTNRIVTLLDRGEVDVLYAELKVSGGRAVVDNFSGGRNGNGLCLVDLDTGRLGPLVLPRPDLLGLVQVDRHPRTGRVCTGLELPFWEETLELVERAALALPMLGSVGWDVAITPDGPQLIEGNVGWGASNELGIGRELLTRLERAAADAARPWGAAMLAP